MAIPLVVVTSDAPSGELLRQNLEETGRFSVYVTTDKKGAAAYVHEVACPLAFVDTSLGKNIALETGQLLRQANPTIAFVIVVDAGGALVLEELSPCDYLSKPFYLPDLLEMMDGIFPTSQIGTPDTSQPAANDDFPWLSDETRAAQHLTRLTLESSAQAALITRNDELWAYAGQLPQPATRELADTVARYWDRQEGNDLVRFIHLASTSAEHMLYATRLKTDMVLALIFDAETPFSTIRTQASQLVHSLSSSPTEEKAQKNDSDEDIPTASIKDILSDIPSPNPNPGLISAASNSRRGTSPAFPLQPAESPIFNRESSPGMPLKPLVAVAQDESLLTTLEPTIQSPATTRRTHIRKSEAEMDELGETRPSSISEVARRIVLEPVSPAVYNLNYACLLVPRLTQHYLTSDLSGHMAQWTPQICVAFGWRLEYISVRPDYLLWIANVPPATSPGYLMRVLRQQTSDKVFTEFPRLKKDNPSGDFWAPGYLIMGGSQPPPAQLIKDFIAQTRHRQGISHQHKA